MVNEAPGKEQKPEPENKVSEDLPVQDDSKPYIPEISDDLDPIDHEIIKLKMEFPNMTLEEISKKLGMHRTSISVRWRKEKLQKYLREVQKSALQILLDAQAEAARRIKTLMRNVDPDISLKACKEVLKGVLSENLNLNINRLGRQRLVDLMEAEDVDFVKTEIEDEDETGSDPEAEG